MATTGLVFGEMQSRLISEATHGAQEAETEPIFDQDTHQTGGILVSSLQEKVAVFAHQVHTLALSDVSRFRRLMARAQARRALLYVPRDCTIPQPVMLLATLSKIELVRVAPADFGLH